MADESEPEFFSSNPVLLCRDIQESIRFYQKKLGFRVVWFDEEGQDYVILGRDKALLHLAQAAGGQRQPSLAGMATCQPADVNFIVQAVDKLWQELTAKEVEGLLGPPADRKYGVRDFSVIDPDGYQIRFNEVLGEGSD